MLAYTWYTNIEKMEWKTSSFIYKNIIYTTQYKTYLNS